MNPLNQSKRSRFAAIPLAVFALLLVGHAPTSGLAFTPLGYRGHRAPASEASANSLAPILGGYEVEREDPIARSTVAVITSGSSLSTCSGVLIAEDAVLTAAHCIHDGLSLVFQTRIPYPENSGLNARKTMIHPEYSRSTHSHDIALIYFKGRLPKNYEPVPLVDSTRELRRGEEVIIAGFGTDQRYGSSMGINVLRAVNKPLTHSIHPGFPGFSISQTDGTGACSGDSGGPVYLQEGDRMYLVGITSRMTESDTCEAGGKFVQANYYKDWIDQTLAQWREKRSRK